MLLAAFFYTVTQDNTNNQNYENTSPSEIPNFESEENGDAYTDIVDEDITDEDINDLLNTLDEEEESSLNEELPNEEEGEE